MSASRKENHSSSTSPEQSLKFNRSKTFMPIIDDIIKKMRDEEGNVITKCELPTPLEIGKDIAGNKVHITAFLSGGRYGDVFLGSYKGDHVAIKKIKIVEDDLFPVESEVRTQRRLTELNAPNAVKYHFSNTLHKSNVFIVMEYLELGSLDAYMRAYILSWRKRVSIINDIAESVNFMHNNGLIHRDIKANNVFLKIESNAFIAKLGDFGHSCTAKESKLRQLVKGSPLWMSLELLLMQAANRKRDDMWAFGAFMWEVAVGDGETPFSKIEKLEELIEFITNTDEDKLLPIPKDTPPNVKELILGCMRKDPKQRLKSYQLVPTLFKPAAPESEVTAAVNKYDSRELRR